MRSTDQMLARYMGEIEERQQFIDGLVEAAQNEKRDLNEQEMELLTRARDRISSCSEQMKPLEEARRISGDSEERIASLARFMSASPDEPAKIEYRSAGAYVLDMWKAGLGAEEAIRRLDLYNRTAAHQTSADSTGLLPAPILGPVVSFVDAARPLVNALGPRQLPSGTFSRPKVTQHTAVLEQSAEKAELTSQKMIIGKVNATASTWGGYVNVSRQIIDWSSPQIMDIIIQDLAAQYAIMTENDATDTFLAGATAASVNLATGTNTADQIAAAFWGAVGQVYTGTKGAGRVIAAAPPQMLGLIGPLFAPVNPVDSQSQGFQAVNYGQGPAGSISGVPVYITAGLADNKILVLSTAAAEVYEDRIGALQVVEPSVLGVQVAYAGYFTPLTVEAGGLQRIVNVT
jgi:HK97 family phage major capsid protein